jgi:hypothetical protein
MSAHYRGDVRKGFVHRTSVTLGAVGSAHARREGGGSAEGSMPVAGDPEQTGAVSTLEARVLAAASGVRSPLRGSGERKPRPDLATVTAGYWRSSWERRSLLVQWALLACGAEGSIRT